MKMYPEKYSLYQLDAWYYGDTWMINDCHHLSDITFYGNPDNDRSRKRLIVKSLKELGITFRRGTIRIECDWVYTIIVERKTGRPLFEMVDSELPF